MNIVTIVGSLRKESYNMQLAKAMQERYREKLNIQIADIVLWLIFTKMKKTTHRSCEGI